MHTLADVVFEFFGDRKGWYSFWGDIDQEIQEEIRAELNVKLTEWLETIGKR